MSLSTLPESDFSKTTMPSESRMKVKTPSNAGLYNTGVASLFAVCMRSLSIPCPLYHTIHILSSFLLHSLNYPLFTVYYHDVICCNLNVCLMYIWDKIKYVKLNYRLYCHLSISMCKVGNLRNSIDTRYVLQLQIGN